ncbi:MAG: hypothetical protein HYZ18_12550 [Pseudogulbenkiania sp.]|nr:hypothetical protein [Pseudogulbenkiania sp.]
MKPHPRNARIKGEPQPPSRFIFGDAVDEAGLEPWEYVVHTGSPAFVCRLVGNDLTPFSGRDSTDFASAVLFDDEEQLTHYVCNSGFRLFDFSFRDEVPSAARLQAVCDEAMTVYLRLQQVYNERDMGPKAREMRVGPSEPLPPAERTRAIRSLAETAQAALTDPVRRVQLTADVQLALVGGDQAVFTEAQLALQGEMPARQLLVDTARDCIAFPEVVRQDGTSVSFELWALPLAFSRAQGGVWWHFPLLERIEGVLADALDVPSQAILWVSPTIFTLDMLNERSCQNLVHLAPVMDSGCDFAPIEPEPARATFEAARQTQQPQLVLAWIPFIVERGVLTVERVRQLGRKALELTMPVVQQAIASEMEYGEAELFTPLPWWEALSAGVQAWNRKRLGMTVALVAAGQGGLQELEAVAEYQPEMQGYEVGLKLKGSEEIVARTPWMLVPDVAPDRELAFHDLASCLKEAGIPLSERLARLH